MTARPRTVHQEPERRCLVTGEVQPRDGLLRFVVDPEGRLVPDIAGVLPGRGYWVTARRDMVEQAVRTRRFERAVARARKDGGAVRVEPGLGQWVTDLLTRRCLDILGLARGAGQVVAGFEKVREFLGREDAAILVEACDGSEDGMRKLLQGIGPRKVVRRFSREQLSLALGRENVVHAALGPHGLGARFMEMIDRLERYDPVAGSDETMADGTPANR
ncbi:MAG: RNA-binding protein [Alphaproteobacteria bacterium]|nr:MAG: RNA-binding protein [Alphaproteobacteria bacterium]